MNVYKIEYFWFEGEHEYTLLVKDAEREEFEKDLIEARDFAVSLLGKEELNYNIDYLGKGYTVECLPQYYEQIIWFLTEKKGYIEAYLNEYVSYEIDDDFSKKISVERKEKEIIRTRLGKTND